MDILTEHDEWTAGLVLGAPVEIKLLPDASEAGVIEGYGATFGGVDLHGDTIRKGAFASSLGEHKARASAPAMLWNHDQSRPVGRWTAMGEDGRGLRVRGSLNLTSEAGKQAHAHLKAGDVTGLSIGYQSVPGSALYDGDRRTLTNLKLHEVSFATVPSDSNSRVIEVKSLRNRGELEDMLRGGGLARAAARKVAEAGWRALAGAADVSDNDAAFADVVKALDRNLVELKGLNR